MSLNHPEIYPTDTKTYPERLPFTFHCEFVDCTWETYHRNADAAGRERIKHRHLTCPYRPGEDPRSEEPFMSMIHQLWTELDSVTEYLLTNRQAYNDGTFEIMTEYEIMKGQAQGFAIAIHLMSRPHFADPSAVAKWAVKRYKMKHIEGTEEEPTPGVAGYNPYVPPNREIVGAKVTKPKPVRAPSPASDPKTGKFKILTPDQKEILVKGMGKLPDKSLAKLVKISDEQFAHLKAHPELL